MPDMKTPLCETVLLLLTPCLFRMCLQVSLQLGLVSSLDFVPLLYFTSLFKYSTTHVFDAL